MSTDFEQQVLAAGWANVESYMHAMRNQREREQKPTFDPRIRNDADAALAGFANYETYRQSRLAAARRGSR